MPDIIILVFLGPRNLCIKAEIPNEKRNSRSSLKSTNKLRQSNLYASSKDSLRGSQLTACCLVSSGSKADNLSVAKKYLLYN